MSASVRLTIERLAPTGEGVARTDGKVVFVDGALPGEEIDAVFFEEKARYARASVAAVRRASPARRPIDAHAALCGGTDWAHIEPEFGRMSRRALFLESMRRIGGIGEEAFGELPISASPLEYRIRNQFHVERFGGETRVGFHARRSHRLVPLDGCEIVSARTRQKLAELAADGALPPGRLEALETIETDAGHALALAGAGGNAAAGAAPALDVRVDGRPFRVSVTSFFQVNRYRAGALFERVRERAAAAGAATALDAYSGVGFLSRAIAEAGTRVTAVESSASAVGDAERNREAIDSGRIRIVGSPIAAFLERSPGAFDLVVADPPRGGLGADALSLAAAARDRLIYVSCEPASLARDLRRLDAAFSIEGAWLEDFFPLTHRVEAIVELRRR